MAQKGRDSCLSLLVHFPAGLNQVKLRSASKFASPVWVAGFEPSSAALQGVLGRLEGEELELCKHSSVECGIHALPNPSLGSFYFLN